MAKELTFPQYICTNNRTISVAGIMKNKEEDLPDNYINGKGYIDPSDDSIWIFVNKKPNKLRKDSYPYFWFDKESNRERSNPPQGIRELYNAKNLRDLSVESIIDDIKEDEVIYSPEELAYINSSTSFYKPPVYKKDDNWKKLIKYMILTKGIDINRLKVKMGVPYKLPNMKTALNNDTKMSPPYFATWLEILGLEVTYKIKDDGSDRLNPIGEMEYDPTTDTLYSIINGKKVKVDVKQFYERTPDE